MARASNIELSSTWEAAANDLLRRRNLVDRVERLSGDFVDMAAGLPNFDVVVAHRVVCCYWDWKAMLDTAGRKADQFLILTFPRPWTKLLLALENFLHWARRRQFRAYVHSPTAMLALLFGAGFTLRDDHRTLF
ncbi:MAG: hypothetical protein ACRDVK_06075, partial [Acidimicrobiia bacterium]